MLRFADSAPDLSTLSIEQLKSKLTDPGWLQELFRRRGAAACQAQEEWLSTTNVVPSSGDKKVWQIFLLDTINDPHSSYKLKLLSLLLINKLFPEEYRQPLGFLIKTLTEKFERCDSDVLVYFEVFAKEFSKEQLTYFINQHKVLSDKGYAKFLPAVENFFRAFAPYMTDEMIAPHLETLKQDFSLNPINPEQHIERGRLLGLASRLTKEQIECILKPFENNLTVHAFHTLRSLTPVLADEQIEAVLTLLLQNKHGVQSRDYNDFQEACTTLETLAPRLNLKQRGLALCALTRRLTENPGPQLYPAIAALVPALSDKERFSPPKIEEDEDGFFTLGETPEKDTVEFALMVILAKFPSIHTLKAADIEHALHCIEAIAHGVKAHQLVLHVKQLHDFITAQHFSQKIGLSTFAKLAQYVKTVTVRSYETDGYIWSKSLHSEDRAPAIEFLAHYFDQQFKNTKLWPSFPIQYFEEWIKWEDPQTRHATCEFLKAWLPHLEVDAINITSQHLPVKTEAQLINRTYTLRLLKFIVADLDPKRLKHFSEYLNRELHTDTMIQTTFPYYQASQLLCDVTMTMLIRLSPSEGKKLIAPDASNKSLMTTQVLSFYENVLTTLEILYPEMIKEPRPEEKEVQATGCRIM